LVYFMLVLTSSFFPVGRYMTFLALLAFSAYSGDFLCALHFYTGATFALITLTFRDTMPLSGTWKAVTGRLPIPLVILSLVFASYMDDGNDPEPTWSRFVAHVGDSVLPSQCIIQPHICLLRV
jgi:hypothetical protein